MPDVPPLHVYPALWRQSREQCPNDWRQQFRLLCQLARMYRENNRAAYIKLPEGERLFLQALDQVDVEDMLATIEADFPDDKNPLLRIAPDDENPYLDPQYRPTTMNGKHYAS